MDVLLGGIVLALVAIPLNEIGVRGFWAFCVGLMFALVAVVIVNKLGLPSFNDIQVR